MDKSLKRLWLYLKPYKVKVIISFVLMVITVAMIALSPLVEGFVTTQLLSDVKDMNAGLIDHVQFDIIFRLLGILLIIYIINTVSKLIMQYLMSDAIQSAAFDLRQDVKYKMNVLPISYYDKHTAGLMSRVSTDVEVISNALQQSFATIIQSILMLVIAISMMFHIDFKMALIGFSILPLSFIASRFIIQKSQMLFNETQDSLANLNSVVQEKFTGFNEIKLYNYQAEAYEISMMQLINSVK